MHIGRVGQALGRVRLEAPIDVYPSATEAACGDEDGNENAWIA